jgi:Methyltransferase FkbM domain
MNLRGNLRHKFVLCGLFLSKVTAREDLLRFVDLIKPVAISHELCRIGGGGDGGYLIPNVLEGIKGCFSPGVAEEASFERQMLELGVPCFLSDFSVDKPEVLKSEQLAYFQKKYIGLQNTEEMARLEDWFLENADADGDYLLQMDIEGAEYSVISDTPNSVWTRFRVVVLEFHGVDRVFSKDCFDLIYSAFEKLRQTFEVVHIHPNNCAPLTKARDIAIPSTFEITLLRKDCVEIDVNKKIVLPHPLDRPCISDLPEVTLPKELYGND